jgi:hypothetical protein
MDYFSKLSNLFVQRNSLCEIYEEFQRDVLELTLNQKTEAELIPVLFAKKLARNLKRSRFLNNHLIDEGVGHLSGYILIAVVLKSLVIDEVTKRFCNVYNNFMFNDTYKFILSYELTVDDIHFLQQRIVQCLGGQGCPFAKNIQVL